MPRLVPLTIRQAALDERAGEVVVVLVKIEHPDITDELGGPLLLSSDPTQVIEEHPAMAPGTLFFGTVSEGETYVCVLMSVMFADDRRGSPIQTQIVFDNVQRDMARLFDSLIDPPTITLSETSASDPDEVNVRYTGLSAMKVYFDENRVTLDLSRENFVGEPWPAKRMTRSVCPALFL